MSENQNSINNQFEEEDNQNLINNDEIYNINEEQAPPGPLQIPNNINEDKKPNEIDSYNDLQNNININSNNPIPYNNNKTGESNTLSENDYYQPNIVENQYSNNNISNNIPFHNEPFMINQINYQVGDPPENNRVIVIKKEEEDNVWSNCLCHCCISFGICFCIICIFIIIIIIIMVNNTHIHL